MKYLILEPKRITVAAHAAIAVLFLIVSSPIAYGTTLKAGEPVPLFVLTNSKGQQISMESLIDKPTVIYFTHNACHYCTQIIAHLKRTEAKIGRKKLRIFGINVMAKNEKLVKAYQEELDFTFPMLAGNRWDVLKAFNISYAPGACFRRCQKGHKKGSWALYS